MYTNSKSIPYYFKYLEYSYLNVIFWPIMGVDNFLILDLKKLNWDLHEYITYKQAWAFIHTLVMAQGDCIAAHGR